ncbi:MAG: efflux RND transporter periplasmic adaptor subunit [Deltaproteobacteria bacterium]|nr:efflux RND transporter periplasmic adaptor subunit [Deltaproteobacteria bacterium]MBW2447763.1 efflux RND transporter periplasmic adaptor subunit [Deltaproteobacteria bacterium]
MNGQVRWAVALLLAVAVMAGAVWGLRRTNGTGDVVAGPAYREVVAERGRLRIAVDANGLVRPIDRIELKSKASGQVIELPIEVGQQVTKGALVAKLDQVDARTELAQARADLEIARAELTLAEKNFRRRKELLDRNVISIEAQDQTELDRVVARSKLVQAKTALERAEERMQDTTITSPVDGLILQKYVESGQIIASGVSNVGGGSPIADIADMRAVHIEAGIDEIDIGKVVLGQHAKIRAEAYPDQHYAGEVTRIAPEARVEQNVTLFDVVVRVSNTDGKLKSGMNATVEIVVVDVPDVLTIPLSALRDGGAPGAPGTARVLLKRAEGYEEHPVRTGRTDHRVIEVLEGLSPGDVLGVPMVSRLKADHDRLDARVRSSRSFGGGSSGAGTQKSGERPPKKTP